MNPRWNFPENLGGLAAGFNDPSMDTFKGRRLSALVREIIQNSLDARTSLDKPVVVDFQLTDLKSTDVTEITSLAKHIELARGTAKLQELEHAVEFYTAALKAIQDSRHITFLCVHDSNTSGLTGPIEGPNGAWYALTKGAGLTQKVSNSSLGSFGHGSKAPFVCSDVRSVFYLSAIVPAKGRKKHEYRFQGKSILQSYKSAKGRMTQGTGFYGHAENCEPLLDTDAPIWARKLRESRTTETGTSILVPCSTIAKDSLPSISITAIANFFYAIKKGTLEVQIGDLERLTAVNIDQKYSEYRNKIREVLEEVDIDLITEAFQTIETIVSPTHHGEQQIQNFGRIDWYFRSDPEIESRSVAVARGNGMLITKAAPQLTRFQNLKPFEFFVCVSGEGSEVLKSIENPEHDNFQFERIDDPKRRRTIKRKYELFSKEVRGILKRFAEYSSIDQVMVDELQDLFSDISREPNAGGDSLERGKTLQIANGNYAFRPKAIHHENGMPGDAQPGEIPGSGWRTGDKKKASVGGTVPATKGPVKIVGPSKPKEDNDLPPKVVKLRNLRMRPSAKNDGETVLFFDADIAGQVSLRFVKSGEVGTEPLYVVVNGAKTTAFDVQLEPSARTSVSVQFLDPKVDFAIEGEAHAIES
jgi:hypothetical protein